MLRNRGVRHPSTSVGWRRLSVAPSRFAIRQRAMRHAPNELNVQSVESESPMQRTTILLTTSALLLLTSCDGQGPAIAIPAPAQRVNDADAIGTAGGPGENQSQFDNLAAADTENTPSDGCRRWITRVNGQLFCLDDLLPVLLAEHPADNDGDGIPNINDDDIDGDGIPNSDDLDVDGDGIPNGYDDDIDDDGVVNELDVDIDGDFLRNRWDPDIDGDLIYNPQDRDADADGLVKFADPGAIGGDCGAAKIFRDPEECDDDDCEEGNASGRESNCKDKGKQSGSGAKNGQNMAPEDAAEERPANAPGIREFARLADELTRAFEEAAEGLLEIAAMYEAAADSQRLDAISAFLDAAIAEDDPDGTGALREEMSDAARAELAARLRSLEDFAGPTQGRLAEATELAERVAAAARQLTADQDELRASLLAVDDSVPNTTLMEDGAIAAAFHEISDEAQLNPSGVQDAIGPAARAALLLGGSVNLEPMWRSIVNRTAEHRDAASGEQRIELKAAAQVAEVIAVELPDPELATIDASLDNVLDATTAADLSDPLVVVYAVIQRSATDPTTSLADGISPAEAAQAAQDAMN